MSAYLIKVVAFASGAPCPIAGKYVKTFDHDAYDGRGYGTFTSDPARAMKFHGKTDAFIFWRRRSRVRPYRADGKANRPLTSTSVSIELEPGETDVC